MRTTLPCGYRVVHRPFERGRATELISHYRTCTHDYCMGRRAEWDNMIAQFKAQSQPEQGSTST